MNKHQIVLTFKVVYECQKYAALNGIAQRNFTNGSYLCDKHLGEDIYNSDSILQVPLLFLFCHLCPLLSSNIKDSVSFSFTLV